MALIKCPECGKEISSQVSTCPSCGYRLKKSKVPVIIAGLTLIVGVALAGWLGQFTRNYTQTTKRGLLTTNKG